MSKESEGKGSEQKRGKPGIVHENARLEAGEFECRAADLSEVRVEFPLRPSASAVPP